MSGSRRPTARKSTATYHDKILQGKREFAQKSVADNPVLVPQKGRKSTTGPITRSGASKRKNSNPKQQRRVRYKPGQLALKEIQRLQKTTDLQIPRAPFHRLVREITQYYNSDVEPIRYQFAALTALQEAAEDYITHMFEDANLGVIHARRVTVMPRDIELVKRIRKDMYHM